MAGAIRRLKLTRCYQPLVLRNHDFMALPAEERGLENIGTTPVEIVEVELK
jgi:hypothetical protein